VDTEGGKNFYFYLWQNFFQQKTMLKRVPTTEKTHLFMTTQFTTDVEKIAALQADDVALHIPLAADLTNHSTLTANDFGKAHRDYVLAAAFKSLRDAVRSPKFQLRESVQSLFDTIVRHLAEVDVVRTGTQTDCDRLLRGLYLDKTVFFTVQKMISGEHHLDAQSIVDEAFTQLYESIADGKYGGRCSLRTYFIGIAKTMVLEARSSGTIKVERAGESRQVKRVVLADDFVFADEADETWADEYLRVQEKSAAEIQRDQLLRGVLSSGEVTDECQKALSMQYVDELSMAQIAAALGIALQSAKNKALRCREMLRKAILGNPSLASFLKESL
jgi:RNA polymerase sigma factor (sigma-70 family)